MKITAQEEYGLRILLRIAGCSNSEGMSIPQLSVAEGLSTAYVAKLTRRLRMAGYINSTPGSRGGYMLTRPAKLININQVLKALGGQLFSKDYCEVYAGTLKLCTNSVDCSVRSLWQIVQFSVDRLLDKVTLDDLVSSEQRSHQVLDGLLDQNSNAISSKL